MVTAAPVSVGSNATRSRPSSPTPFQPPLALSLFSLSLLSLVLFRFLSFFSWLSFRTYRERSTFNVQPFRQKRKGEGLRTEKEGNREKDNRRKVEANARSSSAIHKAHEDWIQVASQDIIWTTRTTLSSMGFILYRVSSI